MDSNRRDDEAASQQRAADADDVTNNPSPTDARNPQSRGPPLSESFHSTDTVRRRPDTYGKPLLYHVRLPTDNQAPSRAP